MLHTQNKKIAVFMIDGFDIEYFHQSDMPEMKQMAKEGFFKQGSCIFPSLTNANNISIACGSWPEQHGVTTNCYYDEITDQAVFLEDASFLKAPTIFKLAEGDNTFSALLTCKSKTTKIIGHQASMAIAAEEPENEICKKYGTPPPMYSAEINYWLFDVALDLVKTRDNMNLIYVHTTDYPMHMWPPDADESQAHMKRLDEYFGLFHKAAPEYTIIITADHGMNYKTQCWDLAKACSNRGVDVKFAVSPVADRLLKHHGGFGGVSYVSLNQESDREVVTQTIQELEGVEMVLDAKTAAHRFNLMASRVGDLVVLPDKNTVFGDLSEERIDLAPDYRSHGSLYEMQIPLLIFNAPNEDFKYSELNFNLDLTHTFYPGNK
jgi:phosphonoacetate hydrolase